MSTSNNAEETNVQVKHNVYFEGKVQSLGLETERGQATVGVMKKGPYQFSTSSPEKMVVISGEMNIKLDGQEWKKYNQNESFDVAANAIFDIICDTDVAYICYYG